MLTIIKGCDLERGESVKILFGTLEALPGKVIIGEFEIPIKSFLKAVKKIASASKKQPRLV